MSKIAVLGAGRVGAALAAGLANAGHEVSVGVRRIEARTGWQGPAVAFDSLAGAAGAAEIVVNALPGERSLEALAVLGAELSGKVLIDVANATQRDASGRPTGLLYREGSLALRLQEALPGSLLVKSLNTVAFMVMANPRILAEPSRVFLSGEDPGAKALAAGLLADLGWAREAILDLGGIESAEATEALFLLVPHFIRSHGLSPFALTIAC